MSGPGGRCLLLGGGGGLVEVGVSGPRGGVPVGETATAAGGTHPTGMHSCLTNKLI